MIINEYKVTARNLELEGQINRIATNRYKKMASATKDSLVAVRDRLVWIRKEYARHIMDIDDGRFYDFFKKNVEELTVIIDAIDKEVKK